MKSDNIFFSLYWLMISIDVIKKHLKKHVPPPTQSSELSLLPIDK